MAGSALVWLGLGWWAASTTIQWASAALARRPGILPAMRHRPDDFSIVAPLKGAADASPAYISALRALSQAGAEVLICVATLALT